MSSIITSLFWIRKNWASSLPVEYENIENNEKVKKIKKITKNLKDQGKMTGEETIKDTANIISKNMDIDENNNNAENNEPLPVFCQDLDNYYLNKQNNNDNKNEEMDVDNNNEYPNDFDEISDEEEEDFTIHPTDSLIVCGTAQDQFSNLEVYIYDENYLSLYVHHDITLSSFPLSIEWLPFKNNNKANYAIIGSFEPQIEIWNLDVLDALEPDLILGAKNANTNNNNNLYQHTENVMSINLNPRNPNIIASGGSDKKILFWDLNKSPLNASQILSEHKDKVQCVKWNKFEENVLISGSFDKTIKLYDVRTNKSSTTIETNSDIECIDWSPLNKFLFLSSYENGRINLYDIRKFDSLLSFQGHKKEATSVSFSNQKESLFMSTGRDCRIKIWDSNEVINEYGDNRPYSIMEKFVKKSTGELFSGKFADDCDYTIAAGGSKGELYVWQLDSSPLFCSRFGLKFEDNTDVPDKFNNLKDKKKMSNKK